MPALQFPTGYFLSKTNARPLPSGKMYIGTTDLDPTILENRISVTVIQEDGTPIVLAPAAQPFVFNAAGMIQYNGSVVQMRTSGDCAMAVYDSANVLQYYFPSITASSEATTGLLQLIAQGVSPTPVAGSGFLYSKYVDGVVELFYMDSEGNELQFTNDGQFNIDIAQSIIEVLQLIATEYVTATQFRGEVIILEPNDDDDVIMDLTLGQNYYLELNQNVNSLIMTNAPDGRTPNPILVIKNTGEFDITFVVIDGDGAESWVPTTFDDTLSPVHNSTTSYGIAIYPGRILYFYPVEMKFYS